MAQFRAYRLREGELVLESRADVVDAPFRVVAPLVPVASDVPALGRLEPVLGIDGIPCAMHTSELIAIPRRFVSGSPVADLRGEDHAIRRALDMLFSGI